MIEDEALKLQLQSLRRAILTVKRAIGRLEFVRDYVLNGRLDRAVRGQRKPKRSTKSRFLASPEWREIREKVLAYYGRVCMACGSTRRITVDHIKPRSKYLHLALSFENLQVLCWECNKQKCNLHETDYRQITHVR